MVHEVRLVCGGGPAALDGGAEFPIEIRDYLALDVDTDMLELADGFAFEVPFTKTNWAATRRDTRVEVWLDAARVMTGFIDDRDRAIGRDGSSIAVVGRDKGGRLLDESAPFLSLEGLPLEDVVKVLAAPWFTEVTFSNAENRKVMRGRGRKAVASKEPAILSRADLQKEIEPGETRAGALQYILQEARLLGWSTADGEQFVVGLPNYQQAPQWRFFVGKPDGARSAEINVLSYRKAERGQDCYSKVEASGGHKGDKNNYGPNVRRLFGAATDGPAADGTGNRFQHPKVLRISDQDIKTAEAAEARAAREMAFRTGAAEQVEVKAVGFGQPFYGGGYWMGDPAIFCHDTIARVEDEEAEEVGDWLVTRVQFRASKSEGQLATLNMVPRGAELVAAA